MALDEADKKEIADLLTAALAPLKEETSKMVNGAMTRELAPLKKQLAGLTPEEVAKLVEAKVAEVKPAPPPTTPAAGSGPDPDVQRQIAELKAANEKLVKQIQAGEEKSAKERAAMQLAEEKTAVTAILSDLKVRGPLVAAAVALLRERGAIKRDDDGTIVLETKGKSGLAEQVPLKEGLTAWLKTEEGKEYLPAREVGGSGNRDRPSGGSRGTSPAAAEGEYVPPTMADIAAALQSSDD